MEVHKDDLIAFRVGSSLALGATQLIPVFVISGEAGSKTKEFCRDLGVVGYFEKPVDFAALRQSLETFLKDGRKERRGEVRARLRVPLRLSGNDEKGEPFTLLTTTENISRSSFLCSCGVALLGIITVGIQLVGAAAEFAGKAWSSVGRTHSTLLKSRIIGQLAAIGCRTVPLLPAKLDWSRARLPGTPCATVCAASTSNRWSRCWWISIAA